MLDCSWNVGCAHIIMLSTEVYFYVEYGLASLKAQFEWLEKDLAVSKPRHNRGFLVCVN